MTMINDVIDLTVSPRMTVGPLARSWAIFDPVGETTGELSKLGFDAPTVAPDDGLSGVDVLVVGTRVLTETSRLPATAADVERGLKVVVFEQSAAALESMGFRTEDIVPRYVFPRVADHPILDGVRAEDLVNWQGAGELVAATKRNPFPYPDTRMHWGNRGSVASVIIETPHQGAFTPICESSFDLAYSPLLEWRHGAGTVVYCQLDVTGRIGVEPAADRVVTNIIGYLDRPTPAGPSASAGVVLVGSDAEDAQLLDEIGFELRHADPADLTMEPGEVVVIGRGATATLPERARRDLSDHVRAGGAVVFLPREVRELNGESWPWPTRTTAQRIARVLPVSPVPTLLSGFGPQLTHWRSHLDLDLISADGLPTGGRQLLDGLVGEVVDGDGRWVLCQLDWRRLEAGGNNTRRPRWNARKFYRQLLTNLGAVSRASVSSGLLPDRSRAPMTVIGPWRATSGPRLAHDRIPARGYKYWVLDGMEAVFHTDPWPTAVGPTWGRVLHADSDGWVDLAPVVTHTGEDPDGPAEGQTAYARTYVYSSAGRNATFTFGPGYWGALKVNGAFVLDDSVDGCVMPNSQIQPEVRIATRLRAGWNRLEVIVCATLRFMWFGEVPSPEPLGFFIHGENPGDLVVEPADIDPIDPPPRAEATLSPTAPVDFYVEPKPRPEDVYRYHVY